ncbi:MAG: DoxX family protein [Bryobacteraceae bacterium]
MTKLSTAQRISLAIAAILFIAAGSLHFIKPAPYLRIMPPYIPWHVFMVQASGVLEILGGLGLLAAKTRRAAAWGLAALLIAIFPANIYMATNPLEAGAASIAPVIRWGRLPLQPLLIWWILWCTRPRLA